MEEERKQTALIMFRGAKEVGGGRQGNQEFSLMVFLDVGTVLLGLADFCLLSVIAIILNDIPGMQITN